MGPSLISLRYPEIFEPAAPAAALNSEKRNIVRIRPATLSLRLLGFTERPLSSAFHNRDMAESLSSLSLSLFLYRMGAAAVVAALCL